MDTIDKLKCCGNCKNNIIVHDNHLFIKHTHGKCIIYDKELNPHVVCSEWNYDLCLYEERKTVKE
jgi:hypothetical protein